MAWDLESVDRRRERNIDSSSVSSQKNLEQLIGAYQLDIYSFDETSCFYKLGLSRGLANGLSSMGKKQRTE